MYNKKARLSGDVFRNFIFGVEDSLVSTVGLLSGVVAGGATGKSIILTGLVLIFVEAFSMGAGSFLSEQTAEEYVNRAQRSTKSSLRAGLVMFVSYIVAGIIPLGPYIIFETRYAFGVSIGATFLALFLLGMLGGKLSAVNPARTGARMLIVGGCAILLGVIIGNIFQL